ncbi:MAG: hypothetical protein ACOZNI_36280 [Myxococcota bacterium]
MSRNLPLFLLIACVSDLLTFDVEQDATTEVEGVGAIGIVLDALDFTGFGEMDVAVEQELENQGVAEGDVESVRVTTFTLSTPDGEDLSFIDTFAVNISAPGLDTVQIAHQDEFPEGVTTVEMVIDDVDLAPYVVAESMTVETLADGEAPWDTTTIDAHIVLIVEATAQAACKQAKAQQ